MKQFWIICFALLSVTACKSQKHDTKESIKASSESTEKYNDKNMPQFFVNSMGDTIKTIIKENAAWKKELDKSTYAIMREKGTEQAFTSPLLKGKDRGIYTCAACGLALFRTEEKFDSGTGWPSFWAAADEKNIMHDTDTDIGYVRDELMCARCGGHLGHVFDDGPKPTGLRYCINGVSLKFQPTIN